MLCYQWNLSSNLLQKKKFVASYIIDPALWLTVEHEHSYAALKIESRKHNMLWSLEHETLFFMTQK